MTNAIKELYITFHSLRMLESRLALPFFFLRYETSHKLLILIQDKEFCHYFFV